MKYLKLFEDHKQTSDKVSGIQKEAADKIMAALEDYRYMINQFMFDITDEYDTSSEIRIVDDSSKAISFDGIDDYLTLSNIDTHSSTAKFTIEGVVKPISGNWGRIFTNGSNGIPGGAAGYINVDLLVFTNGSKPYIYLRVGNSLIFSTQVSTNNWGAEDFVMYFAFSADKQTRTGSYLFRFGQNEGLIQNELSSAYTPGTATDFVENRLGGETDNESYAKMDLSIFKIYNRELSLSEMRQNYNAAKSRFGL